MKLISFLNQKGGVGKTTLALNVAHSLTLMGKETILIDGDPQGSARDWNSLNQGKLFPVVGMDRDTIGHELKVISDKFEFIIVDGAPQLFSLAAETIKISDLVLVPVQPSPLDIWATKDLVDLIKTKQSVTNGMPKASFLISRRVKNTKSSHEIKEALDNCGLPTFESSTTQRQVYAGQLVKGETVMSLNAHPSCNEIESITEEILKNVFENDKISEIQKNSEVIIS